MASMAATNAGVILGTAAYMSPEQARGKPVDKRADIWAFGVVLYEMVTGRQLFAGEDMTVTLAAVVMKEPDFTAAPERVRRVLARCLEKDPKKRLRDISGVELLLEETPAPVIAASPDKTSRLPWMVAATALAAAAVAGGLYLRGPKAAEPGVARFEVQAPQDAPFGAHIRISPDGRTIAFPATGDGDTRPRLWVRSLDSLELRPLAGTEGTTGGLFWLPDSRTLVFGAGGRLKKIDVMGGPAQSICDFGRDVGGGFLTADNKIVFGTPSTLGIQECPAGGGAATSITAFKPGGQEQYHAFPSLLPDGRHFLFWRRASPETTGIYVGSLDARPEEQTGRRVLPDSSAPIYVEGSDGGPGTILFVREGTLMAQSFDAGKLEPKGNAVPVGEDLLNSYSFSASRDGKLVYLTAAGSKAQLTWLDRQGNTLGTLGKAGRVFGNLRISPDGTQLAANHSEPGFQADIWVVDLATGTPARLTTDPASDTAPVWSGDGKRIAFSSNREGTNNLYLRAADSAGSDELLLKTGERKSPLDWSRDGRFLLFSVLTAKSSDVWVLPMDAGPAGERKRLPYLRTDANEGAARFSPDGRFVAYVSDESGANEVYVRPFDAASPEASGSGAGKVKVSPNGGTDPHWALNGKEITYITPDRKLWSVDVTLTPEFRPGAHHPLGETHRGSNAMTPDNQRILNDAPVGAQQPSATVVLNWQAGLKK
jgi:Tol biopolymer transport system component